MPAPLIVAGAALVGLGVGLPTGWKLGRWFFGEEVETIPQSGDIEKAYNLQILLLNYSLSDPFLDKKIYAYYLFSLILSQQDVLIKLKNQIDSDSYIEYVTNTQEDWEETINFLKLEIDNALYRYLCYESLLKRIYGIPYDERDIDTIREKIVPFGTLDGENEYLSNIQFSQLETWIINPLFNGWYDFEIQDVPVILCPQIGWNKSSDNCKKLVVKSFPAPATLKDPNGHNSGVIDVISPIILKIRMLADKKLGKELMDGWLGFIDVGIQQFTGIKAGYMIKTGDDLEKLQGTAADFYNNMRKEFKSFRNSLSNAYSNTTAGLSGFADAMLITGVGVAALFAYNVLFSQSNSN